MVFRVGRAFCRMCCRMVFRTPRTIRATTESFTWSHGSHGSHVRATPVSLYMLYRSVQWCSWASMISCSIIKDPSSRGVQPHKLEGVKWIKWIKWIRWIRWHWGILMLDKYCSWIFMNPDSRFKSVTHSLLLKLVRHIRIKPWTHPRHPPSVRLTSI